jgi:hypothetical protein
MEPEKPIPAHVLKQSEFFARKARWCRKVYMVMRGSQVIMAAVIPFVSIFENWRSAKYVAAALGALISITEGLQQLGQYQQNWFRYRTAREGLNREQFLYQMEAGPYANATDKLRLFVERADSIMADEAAKWVVLADREKKSEAKT